MTDRSYLSIGDVLNLLKDEFPDVTISKIRFLESQGLIDPERTPSGYRKFYPPDVERLRWILLQQKEHFLPLKVIKDRLDPVEAEAAQPRPHIEDAPVLTADGPTGLAPAAEDEAPDPEEKAASERTVAPVTPRPRAGTLPPDAARLPPPAPEPDLGDESITLTLEELLVRSGLDADQARELERFGLMSGRPVAGTVYYDSDAVAVALLAADLSRYGVEARHLRMYKTAAEREAGFFEQIVTPLLKQRNPRSRREAVETVHNLSALGERLRRTLLRVALRDLTGG